MVLGVTNQWAKQFEHISLQPPNWHQTELEATGFNSLVFVSLSSGMMRTIGSMSAAPGMMGGIGRGGGSGGSAGGGSGGGGGGGW